MSAAMTLRIVLAGTTVPVGLTTPGRVELLPGCYLTDKEYANLSKIQIIINNLTNAAARFGMHFTPA